MTRAATVAIRGLMLACASGFGSAALRAQSAECAAQVMHYRDRRQISEPAHALDLTAANGGRLVYIGVRHSLNAADSEFTEIERAWGALTPTVAFYEGNDTSVAESRDAAIRTGGEPGLVRFLAASAHVPARTLEPDRQSEVKYLLRTFTPEQVALFYALRVISELRERNGHSPDELRGDLERILRRFNQYNGLRGVLTTPAEFDAAYRRYWSTPVHWYDAPTRWFDPLVPSSETGGVFTNEVNERSSSFRDLHMYEVLARATLQGQRVFAVVGRDHVPMQAAALRCSID